MAALQKATNYTDGKKMKEITTFHIAIYIAILCALVCHRVCYRLPSLTSYMIIGSVC
jgi:hypothetical protein